MTQNTWYGSAAPNSHGVKDLSEGRTFKSVGLTTGSGVTINTPCASDTNGGIWYWDDGTNVMTPKDISKVVLTKAPATVQCPANTTNFSNFKPSGYADMAFEWYADRSLAAPDSGAHAPYSVDRSGALWVNRGDNLDSYYIPYPEIDFQQVAALDERKALVLGKPRTQTSTTVITQMPTTGAPEGLTTFGLTAVGLGLAGLVFVLVRRHN